MNIFGVGPAELILILIILVSVAGPKRMIQWAYVIGKYTAQLRKMIEDAWSQVRKEFEAVNVDLPKDIPTRANIGQEVNKFINTEFAKLEEEERRAKQGTSAASSEPPTGSKYGAATTSTLSNAAQSNGANGTAPESQENTQTGYDAWLPK